MPSSSEILRFLPEILLTIVGTLLMVLDPIVRRRGYPAFTRQCGGKARGERGRGQAIETKG